MIHRKATRSLLQSSFTSTAKKFISRALSNNNNNTTKAKAPSAIKKATTTYRQFSTNNNLNNNDKIDIDTPTQPKIRGVVKWFNASKGFGFITPDPQQQQQQLLQDNIIDEIFVHSSQIVHDNNKKEKGNTIHHTTQKTLLLNGEQVEFTIGKTNEERLEAKNVTGPNGIQISSCRPTTNADGSKHLGIVRFFDVSKGFGYIAPNDTSILSNFNNKKCDASSLLFVHTSQVFGEGGKALREGEKVEFTIAENNDKKGGGRIEAQNVTGPDGSYVLGQPYASSRSRWTQYDED